MIKKTLLPTLLILCFGLATAFTAKNAGDSVSIKKGKFTVAGGLITPDWKLTSAKSGLGDAERTRDGYNKTHTYDSRGIVIFEKSVDEKPTGDVSEIQFHFSVPEANDVTPKSTFLGSLKVDKLTVTQSLSATTMLAKLKGWKKTDSFLEHSYRMASKGIYIYFQFNASETSLVKVSVGPDKRK
jgi:hypothetical protein